MTSSSSNHRAAGVLVRLLGVVLAAAALSLAPSPVAAQGRCSCNRGCHQYPGQCVQPGSSGCEAGFAPFCGTRADSCPNVGWVSCGGDCTCVRIVPADAGVPDGGTPRLDVLVSLDAPAPVDGSASSDALVSLDAPASPDAATPADAATPGADAPALDAGCACEGGACIAGVCYRERCVFNAELGFICTTPGTSCRLLDADPLCVPFCAGVLCRAGEFCDERAAGRCTLDRCASIECPVGTVCRQNQCGRLGGPDGGVFIAKTDAGAGGVDGSTGAPGTAMDDGCGCRVGGGRGRPPNAALLAAALAGWVARRRGARAVARR